MIVTSIYKEREASMFKSFMKTALAALLLVCATAEARAAQTTVATFHGSVVWANPPAVANGTVEDD